MLTPVHQVGAFRLATISPPLLPRLQDTIDLGRTGLGGALGNPAPASSPILVRNGEVGIIPSSIGDNLAETFAATVVVGRCGAPGRSGADSMRASHLGCHQRSPFLRGWSLGLAEFSAGLGAGLPQSAKCQ